MTHHLTLLIVILNSLAVYRVAMVIARDTISERPRAALQRRYDGALVTLVSCVGCLSVWLGAISAVLTYFFWYHGYEWVAGALSFSAVAMFMGEHS
jgi:hypothetical protein